MQILGEGGYDVSKNNSFTGVPNSFPFILQSRSRYSVLNSGNILRLYMWPLTHWRLPPDAKCFATCLSQQGIYEFTNAPDRTCSDSMPQLLCETEPLKDDCVDDTIRVIGSNERRVWSDSYRHVEMMRLKKTMYLPWEKMPTSEYDTYNCSDTEFIENGTNGSVEVGRGICRERDERECRSMMLTYGAGSLWAGGLWFIGFAFVFSQDFRRTEFAGEDFFGIICQLWIIFPTTTPVCLPHDPVKLKVEPYWTQVRNIQSPREVLDGEIVVSNPHNKSSKTDRTDHNPQGEQHQPELQ